MRSSGYAAAQTCGKELSLEEAFKVYETGIKLTAQCSKQLDKVEKQLITLRNEADSQASDGDEN